VLNRTRSPLRGEIWFTNIPTDPPEKGRRPVIIVSTNARNSHVRANTVLVIPLSTSIHRSEVPTHLNLEPGETGFRERVVAKAEDISVIRKESLAPPREPLRSLSNAQVCRLAQRVVIAMACQP
jgi:mRNA-degrading endonuclease toxin of MazEF toxin-antitoxin module